MRDSDLTGFYLSFNFYLKHKKALKKIVNVSLMILVEVHVSSHRKLALPLSVLNHE